MAAYYNEFDPFAVAWLRNLIAAGHLPAGDVDERSIADVQPADLRGYTHCHFFAGIGGWPLALRLAEWPDDRSVWTGSCPCQCHSSAARGRHVEPDWWPQWYRLIAAIHPRVVFGEQVASAVRWLGGVRDDVEAIGYAFGAADLPACSVGADHARARLWFVCHADGDSEPIVPIDAEVAGLPRCQDHAGSVRASHGVSARVAAMRGFGNAIHPKLAAEFVGAYMDATR